MKQSHEVIADLIDHRNVRLHTWNRGEHCIQHRSILSPLLPDQCNQVGCVVGVRGFEILLALEPRQQLQWSRCLASCPHHARPVVWIRRDHELLPKQVEGEELAVRVVEFLPHLKGSVRITSDSFQ